MPISCDLCKKRAQIFTVNGSFTPTKASVYLRAALYDNLSYFDLNDNPVFEPANFLSREKGTVAKVYAKDNLGISFAGKSYMYSDSNGLATDFPTLYYPIKAGIVGSYDVYIRKYNPSNNFNVNILVDGVVQNTMSDAIDIGFDWSSAATINITDTDLHTLGIQLNNNDLSIDQVVIQENGAAAPIGIQTFTESPYNTIHAQIYNVTSGLLPDEPLVIHDYKNTVTDIFQDGWYNFDLNFLTTAGTVAFNDENYALVIFASGAREKNFVSWELVDSNEYLNLPIAAES